MKYFKATFQRLNTLKGEIWGKLIDLKAQFQQDTNKPKAEIAARKQYSGAWINRKGFAAIMRPILTIFRFLSTTGRVVLRRKAKVSVAPAVDIDVDSALQNATEAPLSCASAKDMQIHRKERVSVRAALVAYRRAGCVYIKRLFMGHKAKAIAAPGAVAEYRKEMTLSRKAKAEAAPGAVTAYREEMVLHRSSKAIAAESAIIESRFNTISHSYEAPAIPAPAQIVPAVDNTFTATHKAQAGKAAVIGANINNAFRASHSAKMATYIETAVVDGVLILRQAYSATKNDTILEVE